MEHTLLTKRTSLIAALLIFLSMTVSAANRYSIVANANWTNPAAWSATPGGPPCGCVPNPGADNIFVQTPMILNIDLTGGTAIGGSLTIAAGASLYTQSFDMQIKAGGSLNVNGDLDVRNLDFQNNSTIFINTGATVEVWGSFVNSNNSDSVVLNGTLILHGSCSNGNGGLIAGTGTVIYSSSGCSGSGVWAVSNTGTLPIELLSFSASRNSEGQTELYWVTATETDNDHFTIERTRDGVNYEVVSVIAGAGTSTTVREYFVIDPAPYEGLSYYRLKQTDYNGNYTYSDLVALDNSDNEVVAVVVYPNPASSEQMTVYISGAGDEKVAVTVKDMMGREFYSNIVVTDGGKYKLVVDPSETLKPGIYMITASSNSSLVSQRVIVK